MKRREFIASAAGLLLPSVAIANDPANDLDMGGPIRCYSDLDMGRPLPQFSRDLDMGTTRRMLYLYAPTWCSQCAQAKKDVPTLAGEFNVRIETDSDTYPQWVIEQASKSGWGFPMVHWETRSGNGRVTVWSGLAAFRQADKADQTPQAASAPKPIHVPARSYAVVTLNGSHYPSKPDLLRHLLNDGIHRGRHNATYLSGMSAEQLRYIHDCDHSR